MQMLGLVTFAQCYRAAIAVGCMESEVPGILEFARKGVLQVEPDQLCLALRVRDCAY